MMEHEMILREFDKKDDAIEKIEDTLTTHLVADGKWKGRAVGIVSTLGFILTTAISIVAITYK